MVECLIFIVMECLTGLVLTMSGISDKYPDFISLAVLGIGSAWILGLFWRKTTKNNHFVILLMGYILRVFIMLLNIYGADILPIPNINTDCEGFFWTASHYYNGVQVDEYTKYPYIINGIFQFFGMNRVVAQYTNMVVWVMGVMLLMRMWKKFVISDRGKTLVLFLIALWPNYILATMQLQRESLIAFFNLLAFYCLVEWLEKKKYSWLILSFVAAIPAALLHSASMAIWAANAVVIAIWNQKKQKMAVSIKTVVIISIAFAGIILLFYSPLKEVLFSYIQIGEISWKAVYNLYQVRFVAGSSDYLRNMQVNNVWQFIGATIIRMLYFMIAPVPWEWTRVQDVIAFFMDGAIHVALFVLLVRFWIKTRNHKKRAYMLFGFLYVLAFAGIFCWGTSNAGTAMRHRSILTGFIVATTVIALAKERVEEEDERREIQ